MLRLDSIHLHTLTVAIRENLKGTEAENIPHILEELGEYAKEVNDGNKEKSKKELADLILACLVCYDKYYGSDIDLITPAKKWLSNQGEKCVVQ